MIEYYKNSFLVKELLSFNKISILGNERREFSSVSILEDIKKDSIVYIVDNKLLPQVINSEASVIIAPYYLENELKKLIEEKIEKTFVLTENPKLIFAYVTGLFKKRIIKFGIDETVKSKSIIDANSVQIEAYVTIGKNVEIGKNTYIASFVSIGDNCKIGDETFIFPGVKLYENVEIGKNCIIHSNTVIGADGFGFVFDGKSYQKIEHLGKIVIEDNVEIGANCCIDRATIGETRIKKGTKIDNLVQIAHNVDIGENNILCAQVGIAGGAKLGNYVTCAGQVGISDHAIVEDNVIAGAQAGLTPKRYPKNSFLLGTPAIDAISFKKSIVLFSKLPDINKKIYELESSLQKIENLIKILQNKDDKDI